MVATIVAVWIWRTALLWSGATAYRLTGAFDTRCLAAIWWLNPVTQSQIRSFLSGKAVPFVVAAALVCAVQTLGHPANPGLLNRAIFWIIRMPTFHILTAVLILSQLVHVRSPVSRVLSFFPLVWLGQLSYSLYLWHGIAFFWVWPAIEAYLPTAITSYVPLTEVGRLATSLVLASGS